jgi:hypothetical protein
MIGEEGDNKGKNKERKERRSRNRAETKRRVHTEPKRDDGPGD